MRSLFLLSFAAVVLQAQTDGITTSATRTLTLPADEATFSVFVSAPFPTSLNQVLEQLSGIGIHAGDLADEGLASDAAFRDPNTPTAPVPLRSEFDFRFTRGLAEVKPLADRLGALERLPLNQTVYRYTVTLGASARSVAELRSSLEPQLVAEARRKAQSMADASGLALGPAVSVTHLRPRRTFYIVAAYRSGDFGGVSGLAGLLEPLSPVRSVLLRVPVPSQREDDNEGVSGFQATYSVTVRFAIQ